MSFRAYWLEMELPPARPLRPRHWDGKAENSGERSDPERDLGGVRHDCAPQDEWVRRAPCRESPLG